MTAEAVAFDVRRVRGRAERDAAIEVRRRVFIEEQRVPEADELDGRDEEGVHLVALAKGNVVATCRLVFVGATVQLSRLAVDRSHRRRGIASKLLEAADAECVAGGGRRVVLHAQTYARGLYDTHGYRARGPTFVEADIEHVAMEKTLG